MKHRLMSALALLSAAALLLSLSACSVSKEEKSMEDFEAAVTAKTGYTLYEDNDDFEGKGFSVDKATIALSEDEENRVEFFQCADEDSARRLYECYGTDIDAACSKAQDKPEAGDFTGDNYECRGASCDGVYYYQARVGKTLLWATGNKKGRDTIYDVVVELGY